MATENAGSQSAAPSAPVPRTQHACPICKQIIYNNVAEYHYHLTTVCSPTIFTQYPSLKALPFNTLWYELDSMIKKGMIMSPHSYYPPHGAHHYHNNQYQPKKRRFESELQSDELYQSMPKFVENNGHKKRKILYHNTSDMRPPKRVNIDPLITVTALQNKIRQTRRLYHNVSYAHFAQNENNKTNKVDHNSAIIHAQKALDRYLLNCEVLRKCFNGKLFEKIAQKFEDIKAENSEKIIQCVVNEIALWQNIDIDHEKDNKKEEEQQTFTLNWKAISGQTMEANLDKMLENENLCGFYANVLNEKHTKCPSWNASTNVTADGLHKPNDVHASDNQRDNKKFIKL